MNHNNQQFNAATITKQFNNTCNNFNDLLLQNSNENLKQIQAKLEQDLKNYK